MSRNLNTDLKIAGRQQRIAGLLHRVILRGIKGYILQAQGETVPVDGGVGWSKGCYYIQTDGGVGSVLYINDGSETSCDFNVFTASGSVAYDDLNAPDANSTLAFAGYTNTWTSTLNGGTVFTIHNTTADLTSATRLLDLKYTDDGDAEGLFLRMLDNAGDVKVSFGADGAMTTTGTITVGVDGTGADVKFFGDTASKFMVWDESADDLILADGVALQLGGDESTADGFKIEFDGTSTLAIDALTANDSVIVGANTSTDFVLTSSAGTITLDASADTLAIAGIASTFTGAVTVGVDGTGHDVKFFGDTASKFMVWDESADDLILADGVALQLGGDESTADGFKIEFDGTSTLAIDALTANDGVVVGGTTSTDFTLTGANGNVVFDASADLLTIGGNAALSSALTITAGDLVMSDGVLTPAVSAGVTADAGSAQGGSAITRSIVEISTVGTTGDSVTLPTAVAGRTVIIINHGANAADVFPASGDAINEGSADAATSIAANETFLCVAYDATNWEVLQLARNS